MLTHPVLSFFGAPFESKLSAGPSKAKHPGRGV
jgi:hypothetical protein